MCNLKNPANPWEHACCPVDSKEEACTASSTISCTAPGVKSLLVSNMIGPPVYYEGCPLVN